MTLTVREPGRFTDHEIADLRYGMDFREPRYRREVFLRFYEFHLKYRAHPGAVYYAFPWLFERHGMDMEEKLWFCFLNGVCQNVLTTYELWSAFPRLDQLDLDAFSSFFRANYKKFGWDTDRKWVKNKFETTIEGYRTNLASRSQTEFFMGICNTPSVEENFRRLWEVVMKRFPYFGRLATFSYLEYLKIAGLPIDCDSLFFDDLEGSKSHRNGLCKVLGRDDLDWHEKLNPAFNGEYTPEVLAWLTKEGETLLKEARARIVHPDVGYFTLESTLCCYKSWHRPNRRYPNVYNDMFFNRIKYHETAWAKAMPMFWEMREQNLPAYLRLESTPGDPGLCPLKQNHYLRTGQPIMMHHEWSCFRNGFNDFIGA